MRGISDKVVHSSIDNNGGYFPSEVTCGFEA